MALVVTFRLPVDVCAALIPGYGTPLADGAAIKAAVLDLLSRALDTNTAPLAVDIPPTEQVERINLSLKNTLLAPIKELAKQHHIAESLICQRLLAGLAANAQGVASEVLPAGCELLEGAWALMPGKQRRVAQAQVYVNLKAALSDGQIAMIEAATGVGKTMAILLAAEERLRSIPDSRVVIAVPTLSIMRQFAGAYQEMIGAGISLHPMTTLFGRREFVSAASLSSLKDEPKYLQHREAIQAWMNQNGAPAPDAPSEKSWLSSTLRDIAPGFPVEACALSDLPDENDPGFLAYQAQFDHELREGQEILICTHAMLAVSTKMRYWAAQRNADFKALREKEVNLMLSIKAENDASIKKLLQEQLRETQVARAIYGAEISENAGKLPPFRYLIVDEAHQLENAMSAANASYLAIHDIIRKAEACHKAGLGFSAAKLTELRSTVDRIRAVAGMAAGESVLLQRDGGRAAILAREALSALLAACSFRCKNKKALSATENYLLRQFDYTRLILKNAIENTSHSVRSTLKFSPVREYPQLYVGANRVDGLLGSLWASMTAAACISATLYAPSKKGFSCYFQRRILAIPEGRGKEFPPVTPSWMFDAIQYFELPSASEPLCPPSRSDKLSPAEAEQAESRWLAGLATKIERIQQDAAGGTLVLMTSYDSIEKIGKHLSPPLKEIAILGSLRSSLTEQSIAFLSFSMAGKKPVWFATGAAWTGLDIGGHEPIHNLLGCSGLPAKEDNILTDLVIPRLPFGINKSVTHEYRIQTEPATPWEILDMTSRLKQGLGRLVRRHGLPNNRRIFLLDGRLKKLGFGAIHDRVAVIVKPYLHLK